MSVRPLVRGGQPGVWRSADGRWTFLRHQGDPHPQRWFAYDNSEPEGSEAGTYPSNEGLGHVRLRDAAEWAATA